MKFGSLLGGLLGGIGSKIAPLPGINGQELGSALGALSGFKTGGLVSGKKGKAKLAIVHGKEFVLPCNCKPTKAQKAIVAKNKALAKKKGKRKTK